MAFLGEKAKIHEERGAYFGEQQNIHEEPGAYPNQ